jgi:4-carboxymuconolactone decarboxylase
VTDDADRAERGLRVMDEVYGEGFSDLMPGSRDALGEETLSHLFGEIWNRPGLSIRDRRLLVMGATTALGRDDLLEVQARGALLTKEMSEEELREMALHLVFYVGIGNAGGMGAAVERAIADPTPQRPRSRT